jgi:hypothetical protein
MCYASFGGKALTVIDMRTKTKQGYNRQQRVTDNLQIMKICFM